MANETLKKKDMKVVVARISPAYHERLVKIAKEDGVTMDELINSRLSMFLKNQKQRKGR